MSKADKYRKAEEECLSRDSLHIWDDVGKTCIKNIETVEIFLKKPLVGGLAVAIIVYVFAAFLYKIKGMPMQQDSGGFKKTCTTIPSNIIFNDKWGENGYFANKEVFDPPKTRKVGPNYVPVDRMKELNSTNKILWPFPSEMLYPPEPKEKSEKSAKDRINFSFKMMIPFYLTLKWTTLIYYSIFGIIKKTFYKANQWGHLEEIKKINKSWWVKDFIVAFICIPFLLTLILPVALGIIFILATVIAPIKAYIWLMTAKVTQWKSFAEKQEENVKTGKEDGWFDKPLYYGALMLSYIFPFFGYMGMAMFSSALILMLHFLWLGSIFMGSQEIRRDGLSTIIRTWANLIYDYRYIWAILAATLWLTNFKMYLHSESKEKVKMLDFITKENQEMVIGVIGGAIVLLLAFQQSNYYKTLSANIPKARGCKDGCDPPLPKNTECEGEGTNKSMFDKVGKSINESRKKISGKIAKTGKGLYRKGKTFYNKRKDRLAGEAAERAKIRAGNCKNTISAIGVDGKPKPNGIKFKKLCDLDFELIATLKEIAQKEQNNQNNNWKKIDRFASKKLNGHHFYEKKCDNETYQKKLFKWIKDKNLVNEFKAKCEELNKTRVDGKYLATVKEIADAVRDSSYRETKKLYIDAMEKKGKKEYGKSFGAKNSGRSIGKMVWSYFDKDKDIEVALSRDIEAPLSNKALRQIGAI